MWHSEIRKVYGQLIGLIGLLGLAWQSTGQVLVIPPQAPPPAGPGDALTVPFIVKNTGSQRDIFGLSLEIPSGLELVGALDPVELEADAEETVFVSLLVGSKARAGTHLVTFTARSQRDPSLAGQASVTVTVKEFPSLSLIAPASETVEPGSIFDIIFVLRNMGNVADRVVLSAQAGRTLTVHVPTDEISLDVGERRDIKITISVPKGAPSVRQRVTLQALSKKFEGVSAEATAVLDILPPLPQNVGGSLFLTIPSQVQFQLEGQTGVTISALVAIRELGGVLVPDLPAIHVDIGGTLTLDNTSSVAITVTISDGRPPVIIAAGMSDSFGFSVSGIFTVTASGGTLISSTLIITVQDLIIRQRLSGGGAIGNSNVLVQHLELHRGSLHLRRWNEGRSSDEDQISYLLDIQNLFELNTLFFALDVRPVGFAIGDLYLPISSLATLSGRGGQGIVQPGFFSAKFSLAAVSGRRTLAEMELLITDDSTDLPVSVIVSLNQPIRFRNAGLLPHTVAISGAGTITLSPGQSFVHLFSVVGQITVTIDTIPITFTVIAEAFCSASFLFCVAIEGRGSFIPGVTVGQAALFGYTEGVPLTTTLLSHVRWQIPGGSATTVEGGLSWQDGSFKDTALKILSELRLGDFSISAQFIRAGRDFVGDRRDEQGIQIFQAFATTDFSVGLSFERLHDNVTNDPLQQTLTRQEARAFFRLKLFETLPTFRFSTVYGTLSGPLPPTDIARFSFTVYATQPIGQLGEISVFTEQTRLLNAVAGTDTGFGTVGSDFSIRLTELRASLRFEHRSEVDLLSGALLGQSLLTAAGVELLRRPFGVRLGWVRFTDRFDLSAVLQARLGVVDLFFSGLIGFLDPSGVEFSFSLGLVCSFDATIPFIVVKGRAEGFVFLDTNGNGQRDAGEIGPTNLILTLGNEKARTDATGFYRFPPIEPGTYDLKIERLPPGVIVKTTLPKHIRIVAGQTLKMDLPLAQVAVIEGLVFHDENRNGQPETSEQGLGLVRIFLVNEAGQTREQRTDPDGRFAFSELLSGIYTVALDVRSLPENFSLTTPAEVKVQLQAQERVTVNFGAAEKPRTVKFPPVAEFVFSPASPKVGEPVRFDASDSFDPDGQIVKYEWDFESDGTIDAQGVQVEHVFNRASTFTVTLTVTDNDNETSTARKAITVEP
jgi:hypothetical protein